LTGTRLTAPLPLVGLVGGACLTVGAVFGAAGSDRSVLLLAAVLFLALVVALMAWPEAAVPLGVFLLYSNTPGVAVNYQGAPSLVALAVPLILAIPFLTYVVDRQPVLVNRAFPWLLLLVVVQAASTALSQHPPESIANLTSFVLEGALVYFLIVNVVRTPDALRQATWAVIGGGAFLATFTVLQNLGGAYDRPFFGFAQLDSGYFLGRSDVFRAQGPLPDANYYAQILLPSLAMGLVMLWRGRSKGERVLAGAAAALCLLGIAFTYSRGAAVALVLVMLVLAVLRYLTLANLARIAVGAALLFLLVPGYGERLGTLSALPGATADSGSAGADISTRSRATENRAAWLVFGDHPLLGAGPGSFPLLYQEYAREAGGEIHLQSSRGSDPSAGEAPEREAHNLFLGMAADLGLAGLFAFGGLVLVTLHQLMRARRRWLGTRPDLEALATGLLVALVGYLAAGVFLSLAFERYLWLLLGLAGATAHVLLAQTPETTGLDGPRRAG
jgi:putative inorganic carbon (HCO3(-)) transporter